MSDQFYCDICRDTCVDQDDPDGQADCRHCGGSFAWRQRAAWMLQHRIFNDFPDAFDFVREGNRPYVVTVAGEKWKLFPSGDAIQIKKKESV